MLYGASYDFGLSEININPKKRSTHYDSSPKNNQINKKSKTSMKTSKKKMINDILFESYKSLNENLKNNSNSINQSLSRKRKKNYDSTTLHNLNRPANNSNIQNKDKPKVQINNLQHSISSQKK